MPYCIVFIISVSSLGFQVLLTRVFSITQWNHLSFMVISIALFGFGASGTFLSILDTRQKGWEKHLSSPVSLKIIVLLYSLTVMAAFMILNKLPLDYFRLPVEPLQALYLLLAYLVLSIPFFLTGSVISIAFAAFYRSSGLVYFFTMSGSALGAISPMLLLPFFEEGKLVFLFALMPLIFLFVPSEKDAAFSGICRTALMGAAVATVIIGLFLVLAKEGQHVKVLPSPYKALSQMLKFPDTRIDRSVSGARGRIDIVDSPYIRFAPGLSLKYQESLPAQSAVYQDADSPYIFYDISHHEDMEFARHSLSYTGYILSPAPFQVLVLQNMGGAGIVYAMASDAENITVVEQHPELAKIVSEHYPVDVVNTSPRAFLAQCRQKYSVIHLEHLGASIPGTAALNQEYLLTVDALIDCLNHLESGGVVILSGKLLLPPANTIRLFAAAHEALGYVGKKKPENHLAVARNWDIFTLIISDNPIQDVEPLIQFAHSMNFDMVYLPNLEKQHANLFNQFERPYYFEELQALKEAYGAGTQEQYFKQYPLDVVYQRDNRPFPNRFLKWSQLEDLYRSTGSRFYGLLLSGEIVVAVVFAEAVLVAFFLLAFPMVFVSGKGKKPSFHQLAFFLGIGAGFMFTELYFIHQYIFLFGSPTISFTVVLSAIMIFSGIGGFFSQKLNQSHLKWVIVCLACLFIGFYAGFELLLDKLLGFSDVSRYIMAFLILLPVGFLMGIPFSIGMRLLLKTPMERTYAWAANGCASVLTSIASAQIAISRGISTIIILAALAYFLALLGTDRQHKSNVFVA
ncbi:MAG: hypothetical protein R6U27_14675 [Desulfobacterales bacterium]